MNHWEIRQKIIDMCLQMNSSGLNQGTSGNISARYQDYMIITPSGVPYEKLAPGDLCSMSLNNDRYEWEGPLKPSSEWHFHRSILQSNDKYGAVIHTHSTYSTVLSMARTTIPACHYMIAAFGGNTIRCADYATFGTDQLTTNILAAMDGRSACLMANHGMVTAGTDLDNAMWAAVELETLSKQYYLGMQLNHLTILTDEQMAEVHEGFKSYGSKSQDDANEPVAGDNGASQSLNGEELQPTAYTGTVASRISLPVPKSN